MQDRPHLFWDFSTHLYNQDGVADACLRLQDEFNIDVNLILFCYWYGSCFGKIESHQFQKVIGFSIQWRKQVVQPLRNVRRWMKQNSQTTGQLDNLRERIKSNELAAEKYQQEQIENLIISTGSGKKIVQTNQCIKSNLEELLRLTEVEMNEAVATNLRIISAALQ